MVARNGRAGRAGLQTIGKTAAFLKEQGKVDAVLADYTPYVSAKFVTQ
ncbi:hypothetical protein [Pseudomonas abietaniphila]|nr:hypothetical protein [Pseudomonas abietaniphila]